MALTVTASVAFAGPDGRISVTDADTIVVGGTVVRIFGIDAPEVDQPCTRPGGETWACGAWAAAEVRRQFQGRRATCRTLDTDRYGRSVARCSVGGEDLGAMIVGQGLATAYLRYSRDYIDIEKAAMVAGRGIFGSDLAAPQAFRAARSPAPTPAPAECAIKGNISSGGRIYHMPGQENYAATRISPDRGERWFCSEAEARAAGWRKARR